MNQEITNLRPMVKRLTSDDTDIETTDDSDDLKLNSRLQKIGKAASLTG